MSEQQPTAHPQRSYVSVYGSARSPKVAVRLVDGITREEAETLRALAVETFHAALADARAAREKPPNEPTDPDAPIPFDRLVGAR